MAQLRRARRGAAIGGPVPHPLLVEKVRNGETGAAAGRGFRRWRPGEAQARREQISRELAGLATARLKLEGDQP